METSFLFLLFLLIQEAAESVPAPEQYIPEVLRLFPQACDTGPSLLLFSWNLKDFVKVSNCL